MRCRQRLALCRERRAFQHRIDDGAPTPTHRQRDAAIQDHVRAALLVSANLTHAIERNDVRAVDTNEHARIERSLECLEGRPNEVAFAARDYRGVDVIGLDVLDGIEGDDDVPSPDATDKMPNIFRLWRRVIRRAAPQC